MKKYAQYKLIGFLVLFITISFSQMGGTGPVKVFIFAGQSNMAGHGHVPTDPTHSGFGSLQYYVENDNENVYDHLIDSQGNWITRNDVWVAYKDSRDAPQYAPLTVGTGYYNRVNQSVPNITIGPEMQFGHVMGDHFQNQVLIIKVAKGGRDLAEDFRPPSSGPYSTPVADQDTGFWYQQIITQTTETLNNLKTHFPDYDDSGFEIVGFGWHQGWNDRVSSAKTAEYESNMENLIKDIRNDLNLAKLPFVVAATGQGGWSMNGDALNLVNAQAAVADGSKYPEFDRNVGYVETRGFYFPKEESPKDEIEHWHKNANSYFLMGDSMGVSMINMLGIPSKIKNQSQDKFINPLINLTINSQKEIKLLFANVSDYELNIRNTSGLLIHHLEVNDKEKISIQNNFSAGVYIMEIKSGKTFLFQKFVITF